MSTYIPSGEQLVVELYVRNLAASRAFYEGFGFQVIRAEEDFVLTFRMLTWLVKDFLVW